MKQAWSCISLSFVLELSQGSSTGGTSAFPPAPGTPNLFPSSTNELQTSCQALQRLNAAPFYERLRYNSARQIQVQACIELSARESLPDRIGRTRTPNPFPHLESSYPTFFNVSPLIESRRGEASPKSQSKKCLRASTNSSLTRLALANSMGPKPSGDTSAGSPECVRVCPVLLWPHMANNKESNMYLHIPCCASMEDAAKFPWEGCICRSSSFCYMHEGPSGPATDAGFEGLS